ncbi:MAG: YkgJ family cysteine cluster protein [Desulfuromusa sp.]|nr:YkgJ family cysteine cluster protein [Desulfuromusa sp.]
MQGTFKNTENIISVDICRKCAECCKNYPFVEISKSEVDSIAKATGLPSDVFAISKGRAVEEYFLQFQENGNCFFLNEDNGSYSCAVYEARPGICADYPSNPKQKEYCDLCKGKL